MFLYAVAAKLLQSVFQLQLQELLCGRLKQVSRTFKDFPIGALQKGRLKLKWSEIGSNGARCLSFLKNAPWTPLKVTEVNQFFLGGLKNVNNPYFPKKNGSTLVYFGLGSAFSNLQTPSGGHH